MLMNMAEMQTMLTGAIQELWDYALRVAGMRPTKLVDVLWAPASAAVGLWWLGESFLDIAPYIDDARAGQLMLLGGVTGSEVEDYHDWEGILSRLGMMPYDHALARFAFALGVVIMLSAFCWGGYILWREYGLRARNPL